MISSLILIRLGKRVSIDQVEQIFKSNLSVHTNIQSEYFMPKALFVDTVYERTHKLAQKLQEDYNTN